MLLIYQLIKHGILLPVMVNNILMQLQVILSDLKKESISGDILKLETHKKKAILGSVAWLPPVLAELIALKM